MDTPAPDTADPTLSVSVNGEPRTVTAGLSLRALLVESGVRIEAVAVAVNGEVVPRARQQARMLAEGDQIEIIRAVGGG